MLIIFACFGSLWLQIWLSVSIQKEGLLEIFQWSSSAEEKEFSNWQCNTKSNNCTGKGMLRVLENGIHFSNCLSKHSNSTFAHLGWYRNQLNLLEQFYYWKRHFSLNLSDYTHANIISNASLLWALHSSNILSPLLWVFVFLQRQPKTEGSFSALSECCDVSGALSAMSHSLLLWPSCLWCLPLISVGKKEKKKLRKFFISSLCQIRPFWVLFMARRLWQNEAVPHCPL